MKKRIAYLTLALGLMMTASVSADEFRIVSVEDAGKIVTLGEYKGLELDRIIQEVTDELVEDRIQSNLKAKPEELTEGTAEMGDTAVIDFVGKKDGEEFSGGSASEYELVLGSGTFIPGFEDGVAGMKVGETKDLELTFPEAYGNEELAGQKTVFTVTLDAIKRTPQLTDEWVKENSDSANVEEYKAAVRDELVKEYLNNAEDNMKSNAFGMVYEAAEVKEYPEADIETEKAAAQKEVENYAAWSGMTVEEFLESQGMTKESFEEYKQSYAEFRVKQNLVVQAIIDAEGLSFDDETAKEIEDYILSVYNMETLEALIEAYGEDAVYDTLALLRVEQFLIDEAKITDKTPEEVKASEPAGEEVKEEKPEEAKEEKAEENTEAAAESEKAEETKKTEEVEAAVAEEPADSVQEDLPEETEEAEGSKEDTTEEKE